MSRRSAFLDAGLREPKPGRRLTYAEQLEDKRWQKKRLEILDRDGWCCVDCPSGNNQLEVHHVYYLYGAYLWEYPDYLLKSVCRSCHERRGIVEQAIFCAVAQVISGMTVEEMKEQPIYTMFDTVGPVKQPDFSGDWDGEWRAE